MYRLLLFVLALAPLAVAQGPFGLRAGMTRKQVEQIIGAKALVSQDGDDFTYATVPTPHPDFASYKLTFSRTYELVQFVAQSKEIDEDAKLALTSAKCEEIQTTLTAKYGKPNVSVGCALKLDKEKPCTMPHAAYDYSLSIPARADKISRVSFVALILPWTINSHGERVVAGCPDDPHVRLSGQIAVVYTFEEFEKYKAEIKNVF